MSLPASWLRDILLEGPDALLRCFPYWKPVASHNEAQPPTVVLNMVKYFPFARDAYEMPMNARAGVRLLIEIDEEYGTEIALKDAILRSAHGYYYRCLPEAQPLAWEALVLLLPHMAQCLSQHFMLRTEGAEWVWTNRLLDTVTRFTPGRPDTLPIAPLDWLGRQVQEDLILMAETPQGDTVCVGGHLCFPASWCLDDKMGRSFLEIHDPVPGFRKGIGVPSDLLMRRLKAGRPVERFNWSLPCTDRLNMSPATRHEWAALGANVTAENAGDRCLLRVERQTLSRLPQTRGVLFTIRTYRSRIAEVVEDRQRLQRLNAVVQGMPPEMVEYKGMHDYAVALRSYLEYRCRLESGAGAIAPPQT